MFLLYLWGIETKEWLEIKGNVKGFYFTYEALKQDMSVYICLCQNSFYFTYEALKLFACAPSWKFCCGCFYFTYEALKQKMRIQNFFKNFSFYFTYEALKQFNVACVFCFEKLFLLYLWGIETSYSCFYFIIATLFLLYLWGIETRSAVAWFNYNSSVFTLPMRHWNCAVASNIGLPSPSFYFTYEALSAYAKASADLKL